VVDKEIAFALENLDTPMREMESWVSEALRRYRITHLEKRLTTELSGGEKQRVALAAATVHRPPVLVLDEPDSYLDQAGRDILSEELSRMRSASESLIEIRITQHPHLAWSYPRVVVLDRGRVEADGPPKEILSDRSFCLRTGLGFSLDDDRQISARAHLLARPDGRKCGPSRIAVENVAFGYGKNNTVFAGLNLELNAGETVGLVGPTGSGKSCLGLLLSGILRPTGGRIVYLDSEGRVVSEHNRPGWVTSVLQQPERQFFLSTCSEEVAFGPANLGRTLTNEEVRDFLDLVGLDPARFAQRDPFSLSVGEKRRLAFAAVLSMTPFFVVFDEPTSALDQEGVGRFITLSRLLKEKRIGQIVISHDGDIIEGLADRVVYLPGDGSCQLLSTGELLANEAYAGVVSRPASGQPSRR
jgi:energy-coupling factor transport system ATP-binding protein